MKKATLEEIANTTSAPSVEILCEFPEDEELSYKKLGI
jgi:hypothetical protein